MAEKKSLSSLNLRNETTGETEEYEIQDEYAREELKNKADAEVTNKKIEQLTKSIDNKADQLAYDDLDKKLTKISKVASGINISGTKLVISL